jgi:misacylated tRNA(Ala) deacylase
MKTDDLFRADAYLVSTGATVLALAGDGVILDRTVFYAQGGGQPGDRGVMRLASGTQTAILNTVYAPDRLGIIHQLSPDAPRPAINEAVTVTLDWPIRQARMRVHTALHLLSVALPYPVTGGQIGDGGEGRLDFDIPDAGMDKAEIAARVNAMIATNAVVTDRWITDAELDANPGLVKTMKVQPPRGSGRVRLVEIAGIDVQPCGGTHVRTLSEIGRVEVTEIEKKGKQNRRIRIRLSEGTPS